MGVMCTQGVGHACNRGLELISGLFEHSVLYMWEIYALENVVFHIAVYGGIQTIHFLTRVRCFMEATCTLSHYNLRFWVSSGQNKIP